MLASQTERRSQLTLDLSDTPPSRFSLTPQMDLQCHRRRDMCVLAQALSADGRCKTFDAGADGYGRGEGFAVAYLNPSASSSHALAFLQVLLYAMTSLLCHHIRISQQQIARLLLGWQMPASITVTDLYSMTQLLSHRQDGAEEM